MKRLPLYDDAAPMVCTIGAGEVPERIALVDRMRAAAIGGARTEHGLLLRFPLDPAIEADVRRFAADEKRCCQFWGFDVTADAVELVLRWDGPPASATLLDALLDYFEGDGALGDVARLL